MEYASKSIGNAGLVTGIIGSALGGMNSGILPSLFGGGQNCVCSENMPVSRYEAEQSARQSARIAELETEVKLRDAAAYTMSQTNALRDYFERKFDHVEHELCEQKAFNAGVIGKVGCIEGQLSQLFGLTSLVIPNRSVCPGYGDVTITPAAAPAAGA